jgi:branched-chain amino acid transport system ATP-binding protein
VLVLNNVEAIYSDVILAVKGISMKVPAGKCVTLLGGNGAGKSTTLKSISNLIRTEDGRVTAGSIELNGKRIDGPTPPTSCAGGWCTSWRGGGVLRHLTVEQNLIVGGHLESSGTALRRRLERRLYADRAGSRRSRAAPPATCPAASSRCW